MSKAVVGGKRRRSPDDEVYFDNYLTHKRYLTEVMASSMNGLSVGDISRGPSPPLVDPMLSPVPTETAGTISRSASSIPSHGDETSTLDSFMSEDSDESVGYRLCRGSEVIPHTTSFTTDLSSTQVLGSSSPSPRRFQRLACHSPAQPLPIPVTGLPNSRIPATPYTTSGWPRCPDADGRLPPSPNDACQSADLRRTTLLRNFSLRKHMPSQPTSSSTTPEKMMGKSLLEQESIEEDGDQSSLNSMACQFYEYAPEQVGCNTSSIMGSPTHGIFPGQVTRGSPRVRSLVLDEKPIRSKASTAADVSTSSRVVEVMAKVDQPSRFEEDVSCSRSPRSPRSPKSPKSPKAMASCSGYEISSCISPKDGNASDTESTFSRRSALRTSLSRQTSVCSLSDSNFSVMDAIMPVRPSGR